MFNILSGIFLVIGLVFVGFGILCLMLAGSLKARVKGKQPNADCGLRNADCKTKGTDVEVLVATKDGEIRKMRVM